MTSSAKPRSITSFNWLYLAATLVGIANIFLHYGTLRNLAIANGTSPAGPFLGMLLLIVPYLIFWFFIYRRGSNVAKWLFVVVTAVSIPMVPFTLSDTITIGNAYAIIDGVTFALQIAATVMLFKLDARSWLGRKSDHGLDA